MKVLDLFSGIGGFSLGLEAVGMETVGFCEINKFAGKVLNQWRPMVPLAMDIQKLWKQLRTALTSLPQDFPAKMRAMPENAKGYSLTKPPKKPLPVQDSLGRLYEPFAWYDLSTQSWRTWQGCLLDQWELFADSWPKAGMIANGIAYQRASTTDTCEIGYSLWPTPMARDCSGATWACKKMVKADLLRYFLHSRFVSRTERTTSYPHPTLLERMMGFPIGHSELNPLETQLSQISSNKLARA